MRAVVVLVAIAACGVDEPADLPNTNEGWEAITEAAPDVGEVRVPDAPFFTPGVSYLAADEVSTWSYWPRRWNGQLGTYGRGTNQSTVVTWLDAIEDRTPALGTP